MGRSNDGGGSPLKGLPVYYLLLSYCCQ